jgi:hypothetical protein
LHEAEEDARERARQGGGAAVAYNYDDPQQHQPQPQPAQEAPSLRVLANCIEKTAEFIATQGAQMEILMRAKEANNLKFQFLNPGNPYHSIYKQVLAKKRSRPRGQHAALTAAAAHQASLEVERSLQEVMASMPNAAPGLGQGRSVGSDNAYSKLVERIRENQQLDHQHQQQQQQQKEEQEAAASTPPPPPPPEKKEPPLEEGEVLDECEC